MLGWLYRILFGNFKSCEHKWEIHKEHPMIESKEAGSGRYGTMYIQKCILCGELNKYAVTNKG